MIDQVNTAVFGAIIMSVSLITSHATPQPLSTNSPVHFKMQNYGRWSMYNLQQFLGDLFYLNINFNNICVL